MELLIFEQGNSLKPKAIIKINEHHRSGDYWHIEIEGLEAGCCYCYRVYGDKVKSGENFYPNKVLLDPCSRTITGWGIYQRESSQDSNNIGNCLKSVVCERDNFDFLAHPRPRHLWTKTIIYELHLGGFTKGVETGLSNKDKGTFTGLTRKLPYLKDLGITTIELLPVFAFDPFDSPQGLENYWGYSPISWFAPHQGYLQSEDPLKAREEVRNFVACCHDEGLEVILDVVYNHTGEGNKDGPVISWKGFGESLYYFQNKKNEFLDVSGCGNSIAANRPLVRKLILESMRCWSKELGVDGFRFDLGIALSRGEDLMPLKNPPLFQEIESDPELSDLKLISEPWDCGGLYRLADFPAKRVRTWNGHFRDDIRSFWKGDDNSTWPLKDRLRASTDLYKDKKSQKLSVNFITAHDGFTLNDLVSYNVKHNLANGEDNRDGENHNNSFNNGIEGPTSQEQLMSLRSRQQRNLFSTLILSPGIPMLLMGDEVGRSQGGNNNTWCQNNPLGWMLWNEEKCDLKLKKFVKRLLHIRKQLPDLFCPEILPETKQPLSTKGEETLWIQWHGIKLDKPDWGNWSHTISYSLNQGNKGSVIWIGLNAYSKAMDFEIPNPISSWSKIVDTSLDSNDHLIDFKDTYKKTVELKTRSLILMISNEYASKLTL